MINITPKNKLGLANGYWRYYFSNGQLAFKGNFINDRKQGYWEKYQLSNTNNNKLFFIL